MANGQSELIAELQSIAATDNPGISQRAINRLTLKALTQALLGLERLREDVVPLIAAYKGTVRLAWTLGIAVIVATFGFLWALITHGISIVTP